SYLGLWRDRRRSSATGVLTECNHLFFSGGHRTSRSDYVAEPRQWVQSDGNRRQEEGRTRPAAHRKERLTMISRSKAQRLAAFVLPMSVAAVLLTMMMVGPASASICTNPDPCPAAHTRVVNLGNLTLDGCTISATTPQTAGSGGGIENYGTLTICNST